uniref:Uncharacterized protein n=1 Tax=uncultured marine virus TaxID=186617 RepID=A0A0F7LAE4_9VIRU|nr:hypothetical protein [uncultured marine virus]
MSEPRRELSSPRPCRIEPEPLGRLLPGPNICGESAQTLIHPIHSDKMPRFALPLVVKALRHRDPDQTRVEKRTRLQQKRTGRI